MNPSNNYYDQVKNTGVLNGTSYNDINKYKAAGGNNVINSGDSTPSYGTGGNYDPMALMNSYQKMLTDQAAQNKTAMDARFASNKNELNTFNTTYKDAATNTANAVSDKYKLPDQVGMVNALDSRIQDLSGNLSNTGAGGYASAGQVDKAINTNYLPRFNTAIGNLTRSSTAANQEYNQNIAPYQTQAQLLNDRIARESTGYTTEQTNELDGLLKLINDGVTLSGQQMDRLNKLSELENTYATAKYTADKNNQYPQVQPGNGIYNTQTGQYSTYYPSSTTGGTSTNDPNRISLDSIFK